MQPVAASRFVQWPTFKPGTSVSVKATAEPLDGSTVKSFEWTQTGGPKAALADASLDTVKVALGSAADHKATLIKSLEQLDRFQVQPINPYTILLSSVGYCTGTVPTDTQSWGHVKVIYR